MIAVTLSVGKHFFQLKCKPIITSKPRTSCFLATDAVFGKALTEQGPASTLSAGLEPHGHQNNSLCE